MPAGCIPGVGNDLDNCDQRRGSFFTAGADSSYQRAGGSSQYYQLPLFAETNLGIPSATGMVGFDNVSLSLTPGNPPDYMLESQAVFSYAVKEPFLGQLGLRPDPIRLPNTTEVHDSPLTAMRKAGKIMSNSWSYTAGAQYRDPNAFASLTMGGRDTAKFDPDNMVGFQLGIDYTRDLLVTLSSVSISGTTPQPVTDLPAIMYVDSTISPVYLPESVCAYFEEALGLVWDNTTSLYLINDTQHNTLTRMNPNITFTVASASGGVDIVLPYAAFDVIASYPMLGSDASGTETSRYFPLQRAQNSSQYALGRTFLQEAYLMVDYDRLNFSLSPAQYLSAPSQGSTLEATYPPGYAPDITMTTPQPGKKLSSGAIAGIAIAAVIAGLAAIAVAYFIMRRRRNKARKQQQPPNYESHPPTYEIGEDKPPPADKPPLNGNSLKEYYGTPAELQGTRDEKHEMSDREGPLSELEGSHRGHKGPGAKPAADKGRPSRIFELDVDAPITPQLVSPETGSPNLAADGPVSPEPPNQEFPTLESMEPKDPKKD
ncbi:MAG: hypothetical protein Q9162_003037 [Coniocarpon cinnabarinum]